MSKKKKELEGNKMSRDTDILNGVLTFKDQVRIDKAWRRAEKIGLLGLVRLNNERNNKRGWSVD